MSARDAEGRYPQTATRDERRDVLQNLHCGLEDRDIAVLIYRTLQRDPDLAVWMNYYSITAADLRALLRPVAR